MLLIKFVRFAVLDKKNESDLDCAFNTRFFFVVFLLLAHEPKNERVDCVIQNFKSLGCFTFCGPHEWLLMYLILD